MKFCTILTTLALSNLISMSCAQISIDTVEKIIESVTTINTTRISYSHSPVELSQLSNFEEVLFTVVKEYVDKLENEPEYFFKRYIADYEGSSIVAFSGWNRTSVKLKHFLVSTNPLWSYRMIWRFVKDLHKIRDFLHSCGDSEILDKLQKSTDSYFVWPTEKDLENSMDSLLILHDVYDLKVAEFANGIIENVVTNASLCAIHCFEISQHALRNNKQYTLAVEWLLIAKTKRANVNGHPILDNLEPAAISKLLQDITKAHDELWTLDLPTVSNIHQYLYKMDSEYIFLPQKSVLTRQMKAPADSFLSLSHITAFTTLCKGRNLQSAKERFQLYCWYESKINPAWYINPQKMELHSKEPFIWQVYDFIGDDMIKYLKREAIPIMKRSDFTSDLYNPDTKEITEKIMAQSHFRTSMTSWLDENQYEPRLPALSKRVGYITGLSASWNSNIQKMPNSRNNLQITAYATGGQFLVHLDESVKDNHDIIEKRIGTRLATFMLYLNDVDLGGNTVFTSVGVAVPPVKGSALFWYSYKRNGKLDFRTYHGGCPVLLGEKWVGNKWIHDNINIFHRKCTLNKDE